MAEAIGAGAAIIGGIKDAIDIASKLSKAFSHEGPGGVAELPKFNLEVPMNGFETLDLTGKWWTIRYGAAHIGKVDGKGKGLTTSMMDKTSFYFEDAGGPYTAIRLNGTYVFAGDQATVKHHNKKKIGDWEKFRIGVWKQSGYYFAIFECKRDHEYWYLDKEHKVRHRNRKEKPGFQCHVFILEKI
eukprot:204222_1